MVTSTSSPLLDSTFCYLYFLRIIHTCYCKPVNFCTVPFFTVSAINLLSRSFKFSVVHQIYCNALQRKYSRQFNFCVTNIAAKIAKISRFTVIRPKYISLFSSYQEEKNRAGRNIIVSFKIILHFVNGELI